MREIVGVVGDVKNVSLSREPRPTFYVPQTQVPFNQMTIVVRTTSDPHSVISAVTKEVSLLDKDLPLFGVKTMGQYRPPRSPLLASIRLCCRSSQRWPWY
jgi:Cu/Ag efflux pump CusA